MSEASSAPVFINRATVRSLLEPLSLTQALEQALAQYSKDQADSADENTIQQPLRSSMQIKQHGGMMLTMSSYVPSQNSMATKLITIYPREASSVNAWIILFDPTNGSLLAMMDGEEITACRTALVSAIATKHIAPNLSSNTAVLAILGSGVQASSHYEALTLHHPYKQVRVWSRTRANAEKFAASLRVTSTAVVVCSSVQEAVLNADVICTLTSSTEPILKHEWVKSGAHINAVGAAGSKDFIELDSELMTSSTVYCDSKEACLAESTEILSSNCEIYAEIGEVIGGLKQVKPGTTTVFKSVGLALEDAVSARIVYEKYVSQQQLQH